MSVTKKRWLEFGLLFVALPGLVLAVRKFTSWPVPIIPALWLFASVCLVLLLFDKEFDRKSMFRAQGLGKAVRSQLPLFFVLAGAITILILIFEPDLLLGFVRKKPLLWLLVMILYPVLSVIPQGIVYRAFVFQRYRTIAPRPWQVVLLSAVAFSLAHVVFWNLVAMGLTLAGGVLFAMTYHKTKTLLPSIVQHAIYGDFVFTIGLGGYLYIGTTELLQKAVAG